MSRWMMQRTHPVIVGLMVMSLPWWGHDRALSEAHHSACHRWRACPSDQGTYVCGDLGYCSQRPDNQYCQGGTPRAAVQTPTQPTPMPPIPTQAAVIVKRVIDGNTLELSTGEKVRLIGVDTPETKDPREPVQYFGKEATAFTMQLVEGKRLRLEYDQQRQDTYGRVLAYVYLEEARS
jgi:Staphylococcal nuclease homologue